MNEKTYKWIFWLCAMSGIWIVTAILVSMFTYDAHLHPNQTMAIISGIYLFVLLVIITVGNITRVRMLMFMVSIYSIGICVRSVFGLLISILVWDKPENKIWFSILDFITIPFTGFYYIASLLTSHFVTEIFWIGLSCISMILLCLSCVGFMSVTGRNKKIKYEQQKQKRMHDIEMRKKQRIEQNTKLLEKISCNDKK